VTRSQQLGLLVLAAAFPVYGIVRTTVW